MLKIKLKESRKENPRTSSAFHLRELQTEPDMNDIYYYDADQNYYYYLDDCVAIVVLPKETKIVTELERKEYDRMGAVVGMVKFEGGVEIEWELV